jgi:hypothetical protein
MAAGFTEITQADVVSASRTVSPKLGPAVATELVAHGIDRPTLSAKRMTRGHIVLRGLPRFRNGKLAVPQTLGY